MSEGMEINSHRGPYHVAFDVDGVAALDAAADEGRHILIDRRVAELYRARLPRVLASPSTIQLDALETTKALENLPPIVERLVSNGVRRNHALVAVGGGIIQDVVCFLAANLLRGMDWWFWPTTLLAQADSCIGSKSSLNCASAKNILGNFLPPRRVVVDPAFLDTLDERDVRSGIGEMLKVHAIAGPQEFARIAADYDSLLSDRMVLRRYIIASLRIKQAYIERDEFDRHERNIFNYGHSFGHAIEAATEFAIPHGIAVTIGCDMANFVAAHCGLSTSQVFGQMHPVLARNFRGYEKHPVPLDRFLSAIGKDKKNVGSGSVTLILPDKAGQIAKVELPNDRRFAMICAEYLGAARAA